MQDIQAAIAAYLQECTGIPAVAEKSRCRQYPLLAVEVRETGVTLLAGGAQAEHQYAVTVTAASDREREGTTALLSGLLAPLLRGIPLGQRVLHPLNLTAEGDKMTFSLVLCRLLPQSEQQPTDWMKTVHVAI